jgi:hypothetical protein
MPVKSEATEDLEDLEEWEATEPLSLQLSS